MEKFVNVTLYVLFNLQSSSEYCECLTSCAVQRVLALKSRFELPCKGLWTTRMGKVFSNKLV